MEKYNLGLEDVQRILKSEFPGTRSMSFAVAKLSEEQQIKLLKEKGVNIESIKERAEKTKRNEQNLLLRAAEFALCCPEIDYPSRSLDFDHDTVAPLRFSTYRKNDSREMVKDNG